MSNFIITTDIGASLNKYFIKKFAPKVLDYTCILGGKAFIGNDYQKFYDSMRNGANASTSMPNTNAARTFLEAPLKEGLDVIHICLSSALSGAFNNCCIAKEELQRIYPERKISIIDSKAAAAGQGLLYVTVCQMQQDKSSYDEIINWLQTKGTDIRHLFTVDSLSYLHRGGRLSKTAAIIGGILGVKPLLTVDAKGSLQLYSKTRGRQKSLNILIEDIKDNLSDYNNKFMFIAHADCKDDAEYCAKLIKKLYHCDVYISDLCPVIGAHSGPGTINVSFFGKKFDVV
jgi:DegV family protein with EDD domain